jgi:uncharacterized protein (TIGR03382 family)
VPLEPAIAAGGAAVIYVEGLSARYVPIEVAAGQAVTVTPTGGLQIAAWIVPTGGALDDGRELAAVDGRRTASPAAGSYTLVVTGLSRGSITTEVDVAIGDPGGGGGCSTTPTAPTPGAALLLLVVAAALGSRRRYQIFTR